MKMKLVTPADGLPQIMQGFRRFLYGSFSTVGWVTGSSRIVLMVLPRLFEEVFVSKVLANLYEAAFFAEVENLV